MAIISFKPKQVTKRFLLALPERARDIVAKRFALLPGSEKMTLEAIGTEYGVTRERVRQVENFALSAIRKSEAFKREQEVFEELGRVIRELGAVVPEDELLEYVSSDEETQNHIVLLLVLGDLFVKEKEDDHLKHRWTIDKEVSRAVDESLRKLAKSLSDDDLIVEEEMLALFRKNLKGVSEEHKNEEVLRRWLSLSKAIGRNPLGEWGISSSPNVNARGMRDYAFLVIRKHGSPMHFTEVAKEIRGTFGKEAHVATCHNELIKDARFVLVGRGLYALSEWGYQGGVVKDVIKAFLEKSGPMTKDEIVEKVLKERYVKHNTVVVNLQDRKCFKKSADGKYCLI